MDDLEVEKPGKLFIAYRVYPKFSKNAYKIGFSDKFDMFKKCLLSFIDSLDGIDYRIHFLLDSCPPIYNEFIENNVPQNKFIIEQLSNAGNRKTFLKQIDILLSQTFSKNILFAEDDYLYKKGIFSKLIMFLDSGGVDFLTPYDHPDYYPNVSCTKKFFHGYKSDIVFFKGLHYRTVASTTLTFLTNVDILKATEKYFRLYLSRNLGDFEVWVIITRIKRMTTWTRSTINIYFTAPGQILFGKKYKLYCTIPSMAIHLAEPCAKKMNNINMFLIH